MPYKVSFFVPHLEKIQEEKEKASFFSSIIKVLDWNNILISTVAKNSETEL